MPFHFIIVFSLYSFLFTSFILFSLFNSFTCFHFIHLSFDLFIIHSFLLTSCFIHSFSFFYFSSRHSLDSIHSIVRSFLLRSSFIQFVHFSFTSFHSIHAFSFHHCLFTLFTSSQVIHFISLFYTCISFYFIYLSFNLFIIHSFLLTSFVYFISFAPLHLTRAFSF